MQLNKCSAIVTGGASGLGAETARHLARAGAKVTVLDVNLDMAREVAHEIGGLAIACDVSSDEDIARAMNEVAGVFAGKLDILVHSIAYARLEDLGAEFLKVNRDGWRLVPRRQPGKAGQCGGLDRGLGRSGLQPVLH